MEATAIRQLSMLAGWSGISHSDIFEGHVGIAFLERLDTNKYTNKFAGYQQTGAHQGGGRMLQFLRIFWVF